MKNLFFAAFAVLMISLASCGGDDCTGAEWAGTYTLENPMVCDLGDGTTIEADSTLVITAGSADDKVVIDGDELTINQDDCTVTFFFTLEKDGDKIVFDLGQDCVYTYNKN